MTIKFPELTNFLIKKESGIYQIKNIINGNTYFGKTDNFSRRKNSHFKKLKLNIHFNRHLQKSFNVYGEENFVFSIVEYAENNDVILTEREQYYLDLYWDNCKKCYNISKFSSRGPMCGRKHNKDTRKQMSQTHTGMKSSKEARKKQSDSLKGREISKNHRTKISVTRKDRKIAAGENNPNYGKTGELSPVFGRKHTLEELEKMSAVQKDKHPVYQINKETNEIICLFESISEAARKTKIAQNGITCCCKGRYKSAGGFKWKYAK